MSKGEKGDFLEQGGMFSRSVRVRGRILRNPPGVSKAPTAKPEQTNERSVYTK